MTLPLRTSRARPAFTLLELLVAFAASTVLLGAMGSIFVLASRALPGSQTALTAGPAAARALSVLSADVAYATAAVSGDATTLSLTLPDRNGDNVDEAIVYGWAGTPGDPLTRTVNGATETLLADTRAFSLAYETSTVTRGSAGGGTTAEQSILSLTGGSTSNAGIKADYSIGQSFRPAFAAETSNWAVTKVELRLSPHATADSQITLQLRTVESDGTPSGTVLAQTTINESSLTGSAVLYPLAATGLTPGRTYCVLLLQSAGGGTAGQARIRAATAPPGGALITSGSLGLGWTTDTAKTLECTVYGTTTTPLTTVSTTTNLERVLISIKADEYAPTVSGAAHALNRPGVGP